MAAVVVKDVQTKPIEGQKTGTSGLRKRTKEFMSENYLSNWIQSLFSSLDAKEMAGAAIVLGGDGRFWNDEAIQIILSMAAAAGFGRVLVGQNGILSTPAISAIIRRRKLFGGLILTASHNPGGPDNDFGIKYNCANGGPAPESITSAIFEHTKTISSYKIAELPTVDLSKLGESTFDMNGGSKFTVEIIDSVSDYLVALQEVFDFDAIRKLLAREDFNILFDAMSGVTGPYAMRILVEELGASKDSVSREIPLPDFGGGHPDPNLTYAPELVKAVLEDPNSKYDFGAASDGDGDRNMILGDHFFVTPSDSVALIAAYAEQCIPYFAGGLKGVARSMPTAGALDRVAAKRGLPFFEVPTGWKFFGNLMDDGRCSVCGEESFGTGSDHVREKDGLWAVLAWLSILAYRNKDVPVGGRLVSVKDVVEEHWAEYGRNFFSRYDYEGCDTDAANAMMDHVRGVIAASPPGTEIGGYEVAIADEFSYTDPVDGSVASKQGLRFVFTDGSRIIFRLSGTGSSGATVRMYIEQFEADAAKQGADAQEALGGIIQTALEMSKLQEFTGRDAPTVIT